METSKEDRTRAFKITVFNVGQEDLNSIISKISTANIPYGRTEGGKKIKYTLPGPHFIHPTKQCYWKFDITDTGINLNVYFHFAHAQTLSALKNTISQKLGIRNDITIEVIDDFFGNFKTVELSSWISSSLIWGCLKVDGWNMIKDLNFFRNAYISTLKNPDEESTIPQIQTESSENKEQYDEDDNEDDNVEEDDEEQEDEDMSGETSFEEDVKSFQAMHYIDKILHNKEINISQTNNNRKRVRRVRYFNDKIHILYNAMEKNWAGDYSGIELEINTEIKLEKFVQPLMEKELGGKHVKVPGGVIDVLSDTVLCEIKRWKKWSEAIGQIIKYSATFPKHQKHIHFFSTPPPIEIINHIYLVLKNNDITMSYEGWDYA